MNTPQIHLHAAIVDLDGTMVDTLGDFEVALNRTLADLDLPPVTRALVERTVGKGSEHLIRSVLTHQLALPEVTGLSNVCAARSVDVLFEPAWQRYQHHYLGINGEFAQVYPGVVAGLDGFFSHVFGGDSFARKKPDPLPLLKTCEAMGATPAQTLMVGDSSNDAQAARAAGCPVVLVRYGCNYGEPVDGVDADGHLDTLAHLQDWLVSRG